MVFEAIFWSSVLQKVIKFRLQISENRGWLHGSFRETCWGRIETRDCSLISIGSILMYLMSQMGNKSIMTPVGSIYHGFFDQNIS